MCTRYQTIIMQHSISAKLHYLGMNIKSNRTPKEHVTIAVSVVDWQDSKGVNLPHLPDLSSYRLSTSYVMFMYRSQVDNLKISRLNKNEFVRDSN